MFITAFIAAAVPAGTGLEGLGELGVGEEFSLVSLFLMADIVVKIVMGILALMSVWSWAIALDKQLTFGALRKRARDVQEYLGSANWTLNGLRDRLRQYPRRDPHIEIHDSVIDEFQRLSESGRGLRPDQLSERIERKASASLFQALTRAEDGLGVLASIGSAAPFIGLFGTVWGIMNSFRSIAASQDTNLAVVAPGIAEALFATALGLLAAIPAVIFFNKYSSELARYQGQLEVYADEIAADVSRRAQERGA